MTVQIAQEPVSSRRIVPAIAIAQYLWLRVRRAVPGVGAAWLVSAIFDRYLYSDHAVSVMDGAPLPNLLTLVVVPVLVALAPIMTAAAFDESLWTIPIRTQALIGWLMVYGAGASAAGWIANVLFIWRPAGIDAPLLWPTALLLAAQGAALASRGVPDRPMGMSLAAMIIGPTALMIAGLAAAGGGVSETVIATGYFTAATVLYFLAIAGSSRAQRGEMGLGVSAPKPRALPVKYKPFVSAGQAQTWFERRRSEWTLPLYSLLMNATFLIMLALPNSSELSLFALATHGRRHVYANSWCALAPFAHCVSLAFMSFLLPVLAPEMRESFGSSSFSPPSPGAPLSPFLGTRPLRAADWAAAKLRAMVFSAVVVWVVQIPFVLLWLALPAWMDGRPTRLGAALWTAFASSLDGHAVLTAVAVLALTTLLTWRYLADSICWRSSLLRRGFWTLLACMLLSVYFERRSLFSHTPTLQEIGVFVKYALFAGAPLKLAATAAIVVLLRRRGLISAFALRRTVIIWAAGAAILTVLICAALAPYQIAWWRTALAVVLLMPGVRLALAPLTLAWDRSR